MAYFSFNPGEISLVFSNVMLGLFGELQLIVPLHSSSFSCRRAVWCVEVSICNTVVPRWDNWNTEQRPITTQPSQHLFTFSDVKSIASGSKDTMLTPWGLSSRIFRFSPLDWVPRLQSTSSVHVSPGLPHCQPAHLNVLSDNRLSFSTRLATALISQRMLLSRLTKLRSVRPEASSRVKKLSCPL